ncbi:MAG: TldD/PmbA family protein [Polyangiaceae bacterium]|nr:TldD/PmbA family protein [Polyangiaceae bacterium]
MSSLLDTAKSTVALAQKKGAKDAVASTYKSRDVELQWRDGKVEKVSEATTRGLSLSLYVDGRYSAVSTSDLRPEALERFVEDSIAMARTLAKDDFRSLPDPKLYEGRSSEDLEVYDPKHSSVTPEARIALAKELEASARSHPKADGIVSVTTNVWDSESTSARVASNGFLGERQGTSFGMSASVTAKDPDGRRPAGSSSKGSRYQAELTGADEVGRKASDRALGAIGSKKIPSAVVPLVVENRVASRLIGALLGPAQARALQQKQSFLEGKLGKPIASKLLTIVDDPLLKRGFSSRHFDSDGISAKRFTVIDGGVLKAYYVDDYYGRKLKMAPTTGGASNLVFTTGKKSLEELLRSIGEGVFVTSFLGGNSNGTTGDYSFGVQGFRVEKGALTIPIGEMNISGNLGDLWKKLVAVGNDPYPYSSTRTPSLVFDAVQFAGA